MMTGSALMEKGETMNEPLRGMKQIGDYLYMSTASVARRKDSIPHYISRGVMYAYKEDLDRWRDEQKAKGKY